MTLSEKVLKVVFIILLLVLLGELSFFFWQNFNSSKNKTTYLSSTPCLECQKNNTNPNAKKIIDASNIEYLQNITNENNNWQFILLQSIEGKVKNLKKTENPLRYDYELVDENGKILEKFFLTPESKFPRKVFLKKTDGTLIPVEINKLLEIKEGVKLKITRYFDLEKPNNNNLLFNEIIIYE
jgi:hypothetical protein